MAFQDNDDLERAFAALTIFDVWERAYSDGAVLEPVPPHRRDDRYKSPFRDDGRTGSFSVCGGGHGFKDFGGDGRKGGVWHFAQMCWPAMGKGDLAKLIIELSGITPTPRPPSRAPGEPLKPGEIDPAIARAAKAIQKRDRAREANEKLWQDREKALAAQIEAKRVPDWPDFVAERYADGVSALDPKRVRQLAEDRGWPLEWADALVMDELVAYPWERWAMPGSAYARRHKAFRVDAPEISIVARPGGDGAMATATLRPVGFHQRWFVPARAGEPAKKGWLYVPSCPKERPRSAFEAQLVKYSAGLGVTPELHRGLVPPLPFVLGDLAGPRLVVLLEGQWDAVTFFGACGWFHETNPAQGVSVFGIRGAQGIDPFLAYWGKWLRHNKPLVWIIADNDDAGAGWYVPPRGDPGQPDPPSFAERLEFVGCRGVITSHLKAGEYGKDFNDFYKAAKPSQSDMINWMRSVGVMTQGGTWA